MPEPVETNAAQAEYWNSDESRHWVDHQDRYDRMLLPFATALLEAAALTPTDRVLDVGCGTGPTTLDAARITSSGRARGVDISVPMIEAARARAEGAGVPNATFDVLDAQVAPFPPDSDALISRFGVMFFDDPVAAFANLRRALAPAGRLCFVCWQDLFANEWMAVPGMAAAQHVPTPEPAPDDAPGPFSFGNADRVRDVLGSAGYTDVTVEPFETSMLLAGGGSLEDAVVFLRSTGMARALFARASADEIERALGAVGDALEPFLTNDGVRLGAAVWLVGAGSP